MERRNAIIYCARCGRPSEVPPDRTRRQYCSECRQVVLRESGQRIAAKRWNHTRG